MNGWFVEFALPMLIVLGVMVAGGLVLDEFHPPPPPIPCVCPGQVYL